MSGYSRLDETGLNTLTEALADATKLQGVIKVCETEAEWNQKTQEEKDDPNIYWFLPWRTSTSGEINDNTTALDKVWSSQKVNSENTALKAMVTDDYVFSPSKAYVAGDWLIHNNILYEVLVACTGVTPPDATYYNPITLHDLKNRIDTLNSELQEQKALVQGYSVTLSGSVGTSYTLMTGSLTLPAGTYLINAQCGTSAQIKGVYVTRSNDTSQTTAIMLGNQQGNNVNGFITLSGQMTLYVWCTASASVTPASDSRFTYLRATRVA